MRTMVLALALLTGLSACTRSGKQSRVRIQAPIVSGQKAQALSAFPTDRKICFGINVSASDIDATAATSCAPALSLRSGFVEGGKDIALNVPRGSARKFEVFAFVQKAGRNDACPSWESPDQINPYQLYSIGSVENINLQNPEENIQIDVAFPGMNSSVGALLGLSAACSNSAATLRIADAQVAESATTATFTVSLDQAADADVSFKWETAPSTSSSAATAGSDYTAVAEMTATIPAGSTSVTLSVPILDDNVTCELDEEFQVLISDVSAGTIVGDNVGLGVIRDNDLPTLSITSTAVVPGTTAVFTVSTSGVSCSNQAIAFDWATEDVTAVAGSDYTASGSSSGSGSGLIAANGSQTTVSVPTFKDTDSSTETFKVRISNVSRAILGTSEAVGSISVPTLDLDFASALPSQVSFIRSSLGTYIDSNRVVRMATINQPRFDHDPITGRPNGLLIEEPRTNVLKYSAAFDKWTASNASVTSDIDVVLAPDGTDSVDYLIEGASTSAKMVQQNASYSPGTTVTYSVFARPALLNPRSVIRLQLDANSGTDSIRADCDVSANTASTAAASGAGVALSARIDTFANGWYRCQLTGVPAATSATHVSASITLLQSVGGAVNYAGTSTNGLYLWGAQLESGNFASSYIPTNAVAVARAADQVQVTSLSWLDATKGTIVSSIHKKALATNQYEYAWLLADGANDSMSLFKTATNNKTGYEHVDNGTTLFALSPVSQDWSSNAIRLNAVAYASGSHAIYENGSSVGTATTTALPSGFTSLKFGQSTNSNFLNGHLRRWSYHPLRLSDSSLQSLSTLPAESILSIEDAVVNEGENLVFTVQLSSANTSDYSFTWTANNGTATLGDDTTAPSSGTVTIPSGSTTATISVATVNDTVLEGSETISLSLGGLPASGLIVAGDVIAAGIIRDATFRFDFLNFSSTQGIALPPRLIYTRNSEGSFFDSTGVMRKSPANLALYSQELERTTPWTANAAAISSNVTTAPDGSTTADRISETAVDSEHNIIQTINSFASGANVVLSVYAKADTRDWMSLALQDKTGSARRAFFNLAAGTAGSTDSGVTSAIASVGGGWYRCSILVNTSSGSYTPAIQVNVGNADSSYSYLGTTGSIYVWGVQAETGTAMTAYTPTTSTMLYAPRLDYDPATCADNTQTLPSCARKPLGLLVENQSQNRLFYSEQFDASGWYKNSTTVTADNIAAPDAQTTADRITKGTTADTASVRQTTTVAANTVYAASVFVKAGTATLPEIGVYDATGAAFMWTVKYDLSTATVQSSSDPQSYIHSSRIQPIGSGWYRLLVVFNSGSPSGNIELHLRPGTGTTNTYTYFWGAQIETGYVPSSYIATTTSAVTRDPDYLFLSSEAFPGLTQWTTLFDFSRSGYEPALANLYMQLIGLVGSSMSDRISMNYRASASGMYFESRTSNVLRGETGDILTWNPNQAYQTAIRRDGTGLQIARDGVLGTSGTATAFPSTARNLYIGGSTLGGAYAHVRGVTFFPRALTDGQMTAFTSD